MELWVFKYTHYDEYWLFYFLDEPDNKDGRSIINIIFSNNIIRGRYTIKKNDSRIFKLKDFIEISKDWA